MRTLAVAALMFMGAVAYGEECDKNKNDYWWGQNPTFTVELRAATQWQMGEGEADNEFDLWVKGEPGSALDSVEIGVIFGGTGEIRIIDVANPVDLPSPAIFCADTNDDLRVTAIDWNAFQTCYGLTGGTTACPQDQWVRFDLNQDGVIDLVDFSTFSVLLGRERVGLIPDCEVPPTGENGFSWMFSGFFDSHPWNSWKQNVAPGEENCWWQAGAPFNEDFVLPESGERMLTKVLVKTVTPGDITLTLSCGFEVDYVQLWWPAFIGMPYGMGVNYLQYIGDPVTVQIVR